MASRLRRAVGCAAAVAAIGLVGPGVLVAQQSDEPGDTIVLTLEEALNIAQGNNPGYRQQVNNLSLLPFEQRATWANQLLPRASVSLFNTGFNGNIRRIATDNFGNPISNPQSEWRFFSNSSQSLSLNWNVQGASIFNIFDQMEQTEFDRHLSQDASLTDLQLQVRRQYFEVLEQKALVAVEEAIAEARRTDLERIQLLFEVARNSKIDVLRAELQIEQQEQTLKNQRSALEQAKLALRTQLGDDDLPPFEVTDEALPVFDPSGLDAAELVERAHVANTDVIQAQANVQSNALGVRRAKEAWWPSLNLAYNMSRNSQELDGDALFEPYPGDALDHNFRIGLSFGFFQNYFGNKQSIEQAEVSYDNAQEQLRQTRLQTHQTVRNTLLTLQNQYASLSSALRSLEIAEEALALAREEYEIGTLTFDQLQSSVEEEANARRQVMTARFGFVDALLSLEDAVGAPVRGAPITDASGGASAPEGGER